MWEQGTLRLGRAQEGRLVCDSVADEVLIRGRVALNRAIDGDVVAVELLPEVSQAIVGAFALRPKRVARPNRLECFL